MPVTDRDREDGHRLAMCRCADGRMCDLGPAPDIGNEIAEAIARAREEGAREERAALAAWFRSWDPTVWKRYGPADFAYAIEARLDAHEERARGHQDKEAPQGDALLRTARAAATALGIAPKRDDEIDIITGKRFGDDKEGT
jgi:hypothetical protein